MVKSDWHLATHMSTYPFSATSSLIIPSVWSTSPLVSLAGHCMHTPILQSYGTSRPAFPG